MIRNQASEAPPLLAGPGLGLDGDHGPVGVGLEEGPGAGGACPGLLGQTPE